MLSLIAGLTAAQIKQMMNMNVTMKLLTETLINKVRAHAEFVMQSVTTQSLINTSALMTQPSLPFPSLSHPAHQNISSSLFHHNAPREPHETYLLLIIPHTKGLTS